MGGSCERWVATATAGPAVVRRRSRVVPPEPLASDLSSLSYRHKKTGRGSGPLPAFLSWGGCSNGPFESPESAGMNPAARSTRFYGANCVSSAVFANSPRPTLAPRNSPLLFNDIRVFIKWQSPNSKSLDRRKSLWGAGIGIFGSREFGALMRGGCLRSSSDHPKLFRLVASAGSRPSVLTELNPRIRSRNCDALTLTHRTPISRQLDSAHVEQS
jgi:hypothetical protein